MTVPFDAPRIDKSRDRAIRLFTYLKELSQLRTKTFRLVDSYEQVVWLADIPQEPGCFSVAWSEPTAEPSDVWVEIRKPPAGTPPPKLPEELEPWLDPLQVADSSRTSLDLADHIDVLPDNNSDELGVVKLDDHPEIKALWEDYDQRRWTPWANDNRRLQRVQRIYADLFSMFQHQQRLGEQYEVVLGLGLLNWKTPQDQVVKRHLIVAQTSLVLDAIRGTMTLGAAGEGAQLSLEQDMIEAQDRPLVEVQRRIEADLATFGDDLWQPEQLQAILAMGSRSLIVRSVQRSVGPAI
jgi:hypothetical protein